MGAFTGLIPLLLIFSIFFFLVIRPEQQRRKKVQELVDNLKVGDKIITTGGIHGVVLNLRNDRLTIRSDQARLEISRAAVAGLQADQGQDAITS